jgi:tetratricopeptide (TPR) repeat protein
MRRTGQLFVAAALAALLITTGCSNQRSLPILREQGNEAYDEGDLVKARDDFTEYVDRKPYDARARYDLGRTFLALGQPSDAAKQLWVAHDVDPDRELYLDALAEAKLLAGQNEELVVLLRTIARDRGRIGDYIRLGEYTARMGDPDEAITALLTAAELDRGQSVEPQMALARFYVGVQDTEAAIRRARMALWIDPLNDDAKVFLRGLGEVPGPSIALKPAEAP